MLARCICVLRTTPAFWNIFLNEGNPKLIFHIPNISTLYRVDMPAARFVARGFYSRFTNSRTKITCIFRVLFGILRGISVFYLIFMAENLTIFRGTHNDISQIPQRCFAKPIKIFRGNHNDIPRNPKRYFAEPQRIIRGTQNDISRNPKRHFAEPPAIFRGTPSNISQNL